MQYQNINPVLKWILACLFGGGAVYLILYKMGILDTLTTWFMAGMALFAGMWAFGLISESTIEVVEAIGRGGRRGYDSIVNAVSTETVVEFAAAPKGTSSGLKMAFDVEGIPMIADATTMSIRLDKIDYPGTREGTVWIVQLPTLVAGIHYYNWVAQTPKAKIVGVDPTSPVAVVNNTKFNTLTV
jgi:hypothetical protein